MKGKPYSSRCAIARAPISAMVHPPSTTTNRNAWFAPLDTICCVETPTTYLVGLTWCPLRGHTTVCDLNGYEAHLHLERTHTHPLPGLRPLGIERLHHRTHRRARTRRDL